MRFHSKVSIVMRLSDGVMVRTRSTQQQGRDVTMEMLNKLVGVPWDPTGVVRARADGGHHDGGYVISGQMSSEVGSPVTGEQTPRSMYITSDLIRQCGPTAGCPKCRSVAPGGSINHTLPHSRACPESTEGLVGNDPLSRDRLSRAEERRAAWPNTLRNSLVHGPVESLTQHQVLTALMHKTCRTRRRGCSNIMVPPKSDEPDSDECAGQMIPKMIQVKLLSQQRTPIKSSQHLVKGGQAQKNLVRWTPTTQELSVLLVARVWLLLSRWFCCCTGRQRKRRVMRLTMTRVLIQSSAFVKKSG